MEAASLLLDGFAKGVQLDTLLFARDSMDGGDPLVWRRDDAVSKLAAESKTGSSSSLSSLPGGIGELTGGGAGQEAMKKTTCTVKYEKFKWRPRTQESLSALSMAVPRC
jgi:hypothetical protein